MLQCLIKVPAAEKIKKKDYTLSETAQAKFKEKRGDVTEDLLFNTRVYKDEKLINFTATMTLSELQFYIKDQGLKWTILAATNGTKQNEEGVTEINSLLNYDPDEVINFIKRKRIYKDGIFVREEGPTTIELGRFAGFEDFEPEIL